jgi:Glycoside hydrolase family 44
MKFFRATSNCCLAAVPLLLTCATLAQTPKVTLSIDVGADLHSIDPNIYGLAQYQLAQYPDGAKFAEEIKLPNIRWGGDSTTRYNWQVDSSNDGNDFFFLGGSGVSNPIPSGQVDTMIETYKHAGANPLITIPIIPYINSTSQFTCSYLESNLQFTPPGASTETIDGYGPQQAYNPVITLQPGNDQCGNGITLNGDQLLDTNIYYNHVDNSVAIQEGWVKHLVDKFGKGDKGGIHYFQLDNEPGGWGNTHVDVEPNGAPYSTITDLGEQYATAIKQVDDSALVFGPSDFTLGGWIGDTTQQDGLYAGQYYLKQFAEYDKESRSRSLDYFDEHFYGPGGSTPAEIQSTRALWDPTYNSGTWVEQSVFDGPMQLLPRFKSWIKQYYPGTKLSLSEFSLTVGGTTIYDALTQADALGIFGRQGLDFANEWYVPEPSSPVAYSYRLYRNYDGKGSQYGDIWVDSVSSDQTKLAVYGSVRDTDLALTMVIINKTANPISSPVKISNFESIAKVAKAYTYSGANLTSIVAQPNIKLSKNYVEVKGFSSTFPAYSATLVVIPSS